MALSIHTSNRLEILVQLLAKEVRQPLKSPLTPDIVVVQSRGMERWVSLELARHNGIIANCRFPFPDVFFRELAATVNPEQTTDRSYDTDFLTFRIMKCLPSLLHRSEFRPVKQYLHDDPCRIKLYQLSMNIADLFDQYLVFRPDIMLEWEKGTPDEPTEHRWQVVLWRHLTQEIKGPHRARLQQTLVKSIPFLEPSIDRLPERVALFAISYMSPFHLDTLRALANVIPITVYYQNPCREYWADIVTHPEAQRIKSTQRIQEQPESYLHLDKGNPLLASLGGVGRDFLKRILDLDCEIFEHFEDISVNSLLTQVQSDILNLDDPTGVGDGAQTDPLHPRVWETVSSIRINACHSAMRELEVLYDFLLDLLEHNKALSPSDIVVMAPDIDAYAPLIQAVFDGSNDSTFKLPYTIADRIIGHTSRMIDGFFAMLDLHQSRLTASAIVALLEISAIREKFHFTESDIIEVNRWLNEINVRWGVDEAHKSKLGLFSSPDHTWKAGMPKLLLGYAMSADPQRLFSGVLPYDRLDSSAAPVLGKLLDYVDAVIEFVDNLTHPRTLENWRTFFIDTIHSFFHPSDVDEPEFQMLLRMLDKFRQIEDSVDYQTAIDCEVARQLLTRYVYQSYKTGGFLTGGITFCAMLPMRSIPFEVVCLLGLSHDEYPRESRHLEFDLIRSTPRPGDRSRRNDDKYMFLEAILSAHQVFYASYVGQDKQDNSSKPPSVVITDLLDYVNRGYGVKEDRLVTHHRLQAFSPDYFNGSDPHLFSYSADNCKASLALVNRKTGLEPFVTTPIPPPDDDYKSLGIDQLCRFYANPARYLLNHRFGLYLHEMHERVSDIEDFSVEGLNRYYLEQDQYHLFENALTREEIYRIQKAGGRLPVGAVGKYHFDQLSSAVSLFMDKIEGFQSPKTGGDRSYELQIDGFVVAGQFSGRTTDGYLKIRYGKQRVRDILAAWIHHLVFCIAVEDEQPQKTILISKDGAIRFKRPSDPESQLKTLLELYWQGLSSPLPFFPEASYAFAYHLRIKREPPEKALQAATRKWLGSDYIKGEKNDEYLGICFRSSNPLDELFQVVSKQIVSPILDHGDELSLTEVNSPARWTG